MCCFRAASESSWLQLMGIWLQLAPVRIELTTATRAELWRRTNHCVSRTVSFPTLLVFKLKLASTTHLAAGNQESKCQGFNDHTFLAGKNPCRRCFKRAWSPQAESIETLERLKQKPMGRQDLGRCCVSAAGPACSARVRAAEPRHIPACSAPAAH
jgi:hypothetical protein